MDAILSHELKTALHILQENEGIFHPSATLYRDDEACCYMTYGGEVDAPYGPIADLAAGIVMVKADRVVLCLDTFISRYEKEEGIPPNEPPPSENPDSLNAMVVLDFTVGGLKDGAVQVYGIADDGEVTVEEPPMENHESFEAMSHSMKGTEASIAIGFKSIKDWANATLRRAIANQLADKDWVVGIRPDVAKEFIDES